MEACDLLDLNSLIDKRVEVGGELAAATVAVSDWGREEECSSAGQRGGRNSRGGKGRAKKNSLRQVSSGDAADTRLVQVVITTSNCTG